MLPALIDELTEFLHFMKMHSIIDDYSFDVVITCEVSPAINTIFMGYISILRSCRGQLEGFFTDITSHYEQATHISCIPTKSDMVLPPSINIPINQPSDGLLALTRQCFDPLPAGAAPALGCLEEAVNLSVAPSPECMEAMNLSIAAPFRDLEALNLSVATSPACVNLSVATSPCFNTVDVGVGTATDTLKTLLDVGTSTEWEPHNLGLGNLQVASADDHVSFTHDCGSDILAISAHASDVLNLNLEPQIPVADQSKMSAAESVALRVLEEMPRLPFALDLSQPTSSAAIADNVQVERHVFEEPEEDLLPADSSKPLRRNQSISCKWCGKSFTRRSAARRHAVVHGEGRLHCKHCNKSCAEPWQLERHEATHFGGNFKCKECGRLCVDRGKLRRHLATHHVGREVCEICHRTFNRADTLKRHIDIRHRKERPFQCDRCERAFSMKCNLDAHLSSVHGGQNVTCAVCSKTCKNFATYRSHIKTHNAPAYHCARCNSSFHRLAQYRQHTETYHQRS